MAENGATTNDGGTTGTGDGTGTSANTGANTEPSQGTTNTGESKTFTQEEVNRFLAEEKRKSRERYSDYDDLKNKAKLYDDVQAASQTDLEKAQAEANKAKERADSAEQRMRNALTSAAIISEASKQGAKDPSLLVKLIDASALEITDDGEVTGAAEAVTALLVTHDYLKGNGFTGSGDGGTRTNGGLPQFTREELKDPSFFREHKDDIMAAYRRGDIKE